MAHFQQQEFVREVRSHFPEFFERTRVLEVGSWILNESVRKYFQSCEYVGADVAAGPGVNLVVPGQDLALPTGSFDVVISCECFEHNPYWLETFLNMARMLRPGGLFVFTCAGIGRGEHGTCRTSPELSLTAREKHPDYYRNLSRRDFESRIVLGNHFSHHALIDNRYSKDLYFVGFKRSAAPDPALAGKIASLRRAAGRISVTPDRSLRLTKTIGAHGEWWLKWGLARLLGEAKYHDIRHFLKRRK
jgi:SAM-dependent methyltransferase